MQHITGTDRRQITFSSLDEQIRKDNPVRIIDAFVEKLDLKLLGFVQREPGPEDRPYVEGRPSYDGKVFLKLYLYGYFNSLPRPVGGIRNSRRLERECGRNIEVRWLLNGLTPNYHTIADFRKDNPKAQKNQRKGSSPVQKIQDTGL